MSILIPVQNSEEVVEVPVDELPEDENDVIDILQAEVAPLDLWLRFAVEYYRQGKLASFKAMLAPIEELHAADGIFEQFGNTAEVKDAFLAQLA